MAGFKSRAALAVLAAGFFITGCTADTHTAQRPVAVKHVCRYLPLADVRTILGNAVHEDPVVPANPNGTVCQYSGDEPDPHQHTVPSLGVEIRKGGGVGNLPADGSKIDDTTARQFPALGLTPGAPEGLSVAHRTKVLGAPAAWYELAVPGTQPAATSTNLVALPAGYDVLVVVSATPDNVSVAKRAAATAIGNLNTRVSSGPL